ncbi:hypothetical protein [Caldovatus aquaticus]|uniref:Polysaccharide chain length determinant N-terminal domain-containing protein n=1 Tax=Caldovatus aquaticus TaxID=2865671 RepID=A0ABS7F4B0_9PROT|nr:hypothetical protein [Caldovatus aquaticus]MBW8270444.1 hypothetical protein [Caldovatus aquaticus]
MPLELLLRAVWRMRRGVALATLALWLAGGTLILAWPRRYLAEAVVAPAETTAIAVSTLLAPMPFPAGGLLDPRPTGNFAVYLGALRSAEAARMLAQETGLLAHLTAERASGPPGWLRRALGLRIEADLDDLQTWLEHNLAVTQSLVSITWSVTLAHPDRAAALDALQRLHAFAEAKVRADLAEVARRRIAALERRLAEERDLFLRQSLYDLLAQQQRAALLVAADEAVAARLVSAPAVEIRPSLPNRPLLLALLALAAPLAVLGAAACLALLRGAAALAPRGALAGPNWWLGPFEAPGRWDLSHPESAPQPAAASLPSGADRRPVRPQDADGPGRG